MRVGIVGVGRIGGQHAAALAAAPEISELVVVDARPDRAEVVAAEFGGRTATDIDALLDLAPDAVVVATTTAAHAHVVAACCRERIPTFCEKPVSADAEVARGLAQLARRTGTEVQVGFQRRFDEGFVAARREVDSGALGELRRVHMVTGDPAPPSAEYIAGSGGIHRDCLIHDFDLLRWVTGREVVEVFAMGSTHHNPVIAAAGDVEEAALLARLDDGTLATLQASRYNGHGYDVRTELAGTARTIVAGADPGADPRTPVAAALPAAGVAGSPWASFLERFADAYRAEIRAFLAIVAGGCSSPCTIDDFLAALAIAEAADRSRVSGRAEIPMVAVPRLDSPVAAVAS